MPLIHLALLWLILHSLHAIFSLFVISLIWMIGILSKVVQLNKEVFRESLHFLLKMSEITPLWFFDPPKFWCFFHPRLYGCEYGLVCEQKSSKLIWAPILVNSLQSEEIPHKHNIFIIFHMGKLVEQFLRFNWSG